MPSTSWAKDISETWLTQILFWSVVDVDHGKDDVDEERESEDEEA